jgi:hypothetical protein
MRKVLRVKPPLPLEASDARLTRLQDFWRLRRGRVMRQALGEPAPAQDSACRLGGSGCTVRARMEASKRSGPDALEPTGPGQRQRAALSVEDAPTFWAPLLADSPAGPRAPARTSNPALEASLGPPGATRTVYRLFPRPQWRQGGPRPPPPRSSPEAQETWKKTAQPSAKQGSQPARLTRRAPS